MHHQHALSRIVIGVLIVIALSGCGAVGTQGATRREQRTERQALVALYEATDGPNWGDDTNWLSVDPITGIQAIDNLLGFGSVCDWYGVTCSPNGYVTELNLAGNNLYGPIPSEIGELHDLSILILSLNRVTGLAPDIGRLQNLEELDLNANSLTSLPPEIGQLQNLTTLYVGGNALTSVPPEIGQLHSLTALSLNGNPLTSLPPEVCQMTVDVDVDTAPLCGE